MRFDLLSCQALVLGGAVLATAAAQPETSPAPFPLELAFTARTVLEHAVDPSGRRLAYVVRTPPEEGAYEGETAGEWDDDETPFGRRGARLWLLDLESGRSTAVGADDESSHAPSWSPDGATLAFVADGSGKPRLCLYDIESGRRKTLGGGRAGTDVPPRWTPDGEFLLAEIAREDAEWHFRIDEDRPLEATDVDVWVHRSGREPTTLDRSRLFGTYDPFREFDRFARVSVETGRIDELDWSFGRETVIAASGRALAAEAWFPSRDALRIRVLLFGDDEPATIPNVRSPARFLPLEPRAASMDAVAWHPTEDCLAYVLGRGLFLHERGEDDDWSARRIAEGDLTPNLLAFTRDGGAVVVGHRDDAFTARPEAGVAALTVAPVDEPDSAVRRVDAPDGARFVRLVEAARATLWQPEVTGSFRTLAVDGQSGETLVVEVETATGAAREIERGRFVVGPLGDGSAPEDHRFLVVALEGPSRPPNLFRWTWTAPLAEAERLTVVEPRLLDVPAGDVHVFSTPIVHPSRGPLTVRTAVLRPGGHGPDHRPPGVVSFYGGLDVSPLGSRFGGGTVLSIPAAAFTSRGFAVLQVDAPLAPPGEPSEPLRDLFAAIEPQLARAGDLGLVDVDRLAVAGASYGGYGTAGLLSVTNRFAAGVSFAGLFDLTATFGWRDPFGWTPNETWLIEGRGRMGTDPWDDPSRYLHNSPYHRADRIHAPLLLLHGADDARVPASESEKLFSALEHFERTAQLAVYVGEGHALGSWSILHATDAARRTLEFLDRHLQEGTRLRGSLVHDGELPDAALRVEWTVDRSTSAPIGRDGMFDLGVVPAGSGALVVVDDTEDGGGTLFVSEWFEVAEGGSLDVELDVTFTSFAGRVAWADDGSVLAGAEVSVSSTVPTKPSAVPTRPRRRVHLETRTDDEGRFRFPCIAAGRYDLSVKTLHPSPGGVTHEARILREEIVVTADETGERTFVVGR